MQKYSPKRPCHFLILRHTDTNGTVRNNPDGTVNIVIIAPTSFPLDGCRRLGGDVVADAVDSFDLVDDVVADLCHEVIGQMRPVGGHGIGRGHCTECYGALVSTLIAHHTYTLHRQKDCTSLPHLVIQVPVTQSLNEDIVSLLEHSYLLGGDVAEDAHCQTRAREGMTLDKMVRHAELATHSAHLVLEEQTERFAQLEIHLLGQTAHIVVALDGRTGD